MSETKTATIPNDNAHEPQPAISAEGAEPFKCSKCTSVGLVVSGDDFYGNNLYDYCDCPFGKMQNPELIASQPEGAERFALPPDGYEAQMILRRRWLDSPERERWSFEAWLSLELRAQIAANARLQKERDAAYREGGLQSNRLQERYAQYAAAKPKYLMTFSGWLNDRINACESVKAELARIKGESNA